MNKMHISLVSLAALFLISASGTVLAQEEPTTIAPEETITISDLGVSEPKVLPTSPFYFFKEMGRGIQGFITFNPVAKAELELKIANEKAAEVKKITETQPQNTEAIQKALGNYQKSQEKLRLRFEKLSETSENPKVDILLNNLTDKVVKHEKLFDEISFKFKGEENVSNAINGVMAGSEDVVGEASKKDSAAKFSSRLEKVLLEEKGGDLKHARSVEIIDRFSGKATTEVKESLERLREEFSERLQSDIESLVEKEGEDALNEKFANTPGSSGKRSVIIEEIQKRAEERLSEVLGKAMSHLETAIKKEMDIAQKAKEQIEKAGEMILEAEKKIQESEGGKTPEVVSTLLAEAKDHLANAKTALEEKKYGEAFGQARSAEILTRNALRFFEQERPKTGNFEQQLKELEEKISTYKKLFEERGFTPEENKDAYELLNNAAVHLEYAKIENTKLHMEHVKEFLSKLSRILEGKLPTVSTKAEQVRQLTPTAANCEEITKKIIELKELLNSGKIQESGFKTKYDEHIRKLIICQGEKNAVAPLPPAAVSPAPAPPTQTACTLEYSPVCGSNGKTYSNACFAKSDGITIIYRGECKSKIEKPESISPQPTTVKPIEPTNSTEKKVAE